MADEYEDTGNRNTGYRNTGYRNTGYRNTGNRNTGDWNTGNRNTGNRNTGDWNTGSRNTGYFMTTTPEKVPTFNGNGEVELDYRFPNWFYTLDPMECDGDMKVAWQAAWEVSGKNADKVRAIPGFDHDVWFEITGIDLGEPVDTVEEATRPLIDRIDELETKQAELLNHLKAHNCQHWWEDLK